MTLLHLVEGVSELLRGVELRLPTEYYKDEEAPLRRLNVYSQMASASVFETAEYYPLCLVELLGVKDELNASSVATVGLTLGAFCDPTADGYRNALNLLDVVRLTIMEHRVIARRFRLVGTLDWRMAEPISEPFLFGYGELEYEVLQIAGVK